MAAENDTMRPGKEFRTRFDTAKLFRDNVRDRVDEIFSHICPERMNDFDRDPSLPSSPEEDTETFTSLPENLAIDFASDIVTYFCPPESRWTEYLVTADVPEQHERAVKAIVTEREEDLFDMIQSSNWNDVAPQIMFEANHGTIAAWVSKGHMAQPIHFETVPPHELLIAPGHMGILDRFREKQVRASELKALFDGWDVSLSDPRLRNKMDRPGQNVRVCWGFWADWEDPGNPRWLCEVTVDGLRVTPGKPLDLGPLAGTCPLLVGRFNPQAGRPWGRGPAWKALRDMRVLNAISESVLDGLDQALRNTLIYADDGFLDFSEGIIPGTAQPASRGFTRDSIYELNRDTNLDVGFFSEEHIEDRLRAAWYQDGPRQRGDTPPTASQWIDERRRVQQRLGKPSAPLWSEFFLPLIQRVEQLALESGRIDGPLSHNGDVIAVLPISPLQKASNQDKVMISKSNLDTAFSVFGEALPETVDVRATLENHIDASGDSLTVVRKEAPADSGAPMDGSAGSAGAA